MRYLEKVCCFFVFARVFLHMCPNEKYEKYLSGLTSWIAFCIFLSPFLSGDMLWESYEMRNSGWERQIAENAQISVQELETASEEAAAEIAAEAYEELEDEIGKESVKEEEQTDEIGRDR